VFGGIAGDGMAALGKNQTACSRTKRRSRAKAWHHAWRRFRGRPGTSGDSRALFDCVLTNVGICALQGLQRAPRYPVNAPVNGYQVLGDRWRPRFNLSWRDWHST
jgi:hypothetical protein